MSKGKKIRKQLKKQEKPSTNQRRKQKYGKMARGGMRGQKEIARGKSVDRIESRDSEVHSVVPSADYSAYSGEYSPKPRFPREVLPKGEFRKVPKIDLIGSSEAVEKTHEGIVIYDVGNDRVLVAGVDLPERIKGPGVRSYRTHVRDRKDSSGNEMSLDVACVHQISSLCGLEKWEGRSNIGVSVMKNFEELFPMMRSVSPEGVHAFDDFINVVRRGYERIQQDFSDTIMPSHGRLFDVTYALVHGAAIPSENYTLAINETEQRVIEMKREAKMAENFGQQTWKEYKESRSNQRIPSWMTRGHY